MITYIKGVLDYIGENSIIVDVQGVGYEVLTPMSVLANLTHTGETIKIHTYLYVREDAMLLYGFLTRDDLFVFKKLITVNGIGPKGALGILSTISPDDLRMAILAEDVNTISKAPGIGKKTAQKLILELKDKLKLAVQPSTVEAIKVSSNLAASQINDAVQALAALGYTQTEALKAVRSVSLNEEMTIEELIKAALKKLSLT